MVVSREELGRRVQRAITDAGLTQADLAARIGMSPSALSRAIAGVRNFKSLELARIAEVLQISTEALLRDSQPPAVRLAARLAVQSNPAIETALGRAQEIVDLDRLLADVGYESPKTPEFVCEPASEPYREGEQLAKLVRSELGERELPYKLDGLAALIEQRLGVDVSFQPLPDGFDGLSISTGSLKLALVSSDAAATRQRFTLAHELGHLIAGDVEEVRIDEDVFGRRTRDEERANGFAAAFLMPADELRAEVRGRFVSEELVANLLDKYGVSLESLAFRLHNLGLINAATRDRIRSTRSSRIALRRGRTVDLQARKKVRHPGNLLSRAVEAYIRGHISVRPLARLLGADPEELLEELSLPVPKELDSDEWGQAL